MYPNSCKNAITHFLKMKKFIKLLAVGMILAGAFMLSGCSSRDDALVGTWVWEDDSSWVTTFNADGTGTHAISWGYGTSFQLDNTR